MYRSPYRYRRHRRQKNHSGHYVMPFLILISIGVIAVLIFNLWKAIFAPATTQAAYMHIVEGDAELKVWGTEHFFDINTDTLIMQGDQIKTAAGTKIIIEFFDGTIMRIDGGSDVVFDFIDEKKPSIELILNEGSLWFNKVYRDTRDTKIIVEMDNIVVNSGGASVFALEDINNQVVRVKNVFSDKRGLDVDVMSEDKKKVVESESIGVAQEITFSSKVLENYWQFKSPTVLQGISDEFKDSEWYIWNTSQDIKPLDFDKSAGGTEDVGLVPVAEEKLEVEEELLEEEKTNISDEPEVEKVDGEIVSLTVPEITSVSGSTEVNADGFYVVKSNPAVIVGLVGGASKVTVNGYALQKFKAGDTTFTYFANADYELMKPGENTYEVYAYDEKNRKSEPLVIKVLYVVQEPVSEQTEEPLD